MQRRVVRGRAWRRSSHRGWSAATGVARWGTRLQESTRVAREPRSSPSGGASRPSHSHRHEFPRRRLASPLATKVPQLLSDLQEFRSVEEWNEYQSDSETPMTRADARSEVHRIATDEIPKLEEQLRVDFREIIEISDLRDKDAQPSWGRRVSGGVSLLFSEGFSDGSLLGSLLFSGGFSGAPSSRKMTRPRGRNSYPLYFVATTLDTPRG
jgi:hypothetical protein